MLVSWIFLTSLLGMCLDNVLPENSLSNFGRQKIYSATQKMSTAKNSDISKVSTLGISQQGKIKSSPAGLSERATTELYKGNKMKRSSQLSKGETSGAEGLFDQTCCLERKESAETWYVFFYGESQNFGMEVENCGSKKEPCFHIQTVMDKLQEGDTVVLTQNTKQGQPVTNITSRAGQAAEYTVSFFLKSDVKHSGNFPNKLSLLHLKTRSKFASLFLQDTTFVNTHISAQDASLCIFNTSFYNSIFSTESLLIPTNLVVFNSQFKAQNSAVFLNKRTFVNVTGSWNSVLVQDSRFECDSETLCSGLSFTEAAISEVRCVNSVFFELHSVFACEGESGLMVIHFDSVLFSRNWNVISLSKCEVNKLIVQESQFVSNGFLGDRDRGNMSCSSIISASQSFVLVSRSKFAGNQVFSAVCHEGLIICVNCTVVIENAWFLNNSYEGSEFRGLVMFSNSNVTVSDSKFLDNRGRCVTVENQVPLKDGETNCALNVSNCVFLENQAEGCGSVVSGINGNIVLNSCSVSRNRAQNGGVMCLENSHTTLVNSHFSSNKAESFGGVVCILFSGSLEILNSSFSGNSVENTGGGVLYADSTNILVDGAQFQSNSAGVELKKWNSGRGGVGYISGSNMTLINSDFTNNSAWWSGGALCTFGNITTIKTCNFVENSATIDGGVLYVASGSLGIEDSNFTSNHVVENGGGVLHAEGAGVLIVRSRFEGNEVTSGEGGVVWMTESHMTVTSSHFLRNSAGWYGGVVGASKSDVTMTTCIFVINAATYAGGVVGVKYSDVTITVSSFQGNTAFYGGVFEAGFSMMKLSVSEFTNNSASLDGGVLSANDHSTITFIASQFCSNTATQYAGVAGADSYCNLSFISSSFTDNNAGEKGGVVYVQYVKQLTVMSSTFSNNTAVAGAVLHSYLSNSLLLDGGEMVNNTVSHYGAVILAIKSCVHLKAFHIESNTGTALVLLQINELRNSSRIENCTFKQNLQGNYSKFGADIFSSAPIILQDLTIRKSWNVEGSTSIISIDKAIVSSLQVYLENGLPSTVVAFNKLLWNSSVYQTEVHVHCPEFIQPVQKYTSTSEEGVSMLQIDCDLCPSGYHVGSKAITTYLSTSAFPHMKCEIQKNMWGDILFALCHSNVTGSCFPCPHGADCSSGMNALPNYWGHTFQQNFIAMVRCPASYCCEQFPCAGVDTCSDKREGVLCGRCVSGFTEAFSSEQCIDNSYCDSHWFVWTYTAWILCLATAVFFMSDIKEYLETIQRKLKTLRHKDSLKEDANPGKEEESMAQLNTLTVKSTVVSRKGIWKVTTPETCDQTDTHSSTLKYLQIILFYIQDASLLEVDLPKAKGNGQSNFTKWLFDFSHLAVDVVNFGKNICLTKDLTPVPKLLIKNICGPSILLLCGCVYTLFNVISCCVTPTQTAKKLVYDHLVSTTMFVLLIYFQKMATTFMSLVYCVQVGDNYVLHIDGTIQCYQPWQLGSFVFIFCWVVPFVFVLIFGPGLVADSKISVCEFFVACFLPVPLLMWWALRTRMNHWGETRQDVTSWQTTLTDELQKTYKDISLVKLGPVCWIGIIKSRRLCLVIIFTFVENLAARLALMISFTVLFLCLHLTIYPYRDKIANQLFTFSLLASGLLGLLNFTKAVIVEAMVDLKKTEGLISACDMIKDVVLLWGPACVLASFTVLILVRKIVSLMKKCFKTKEEEKGDEEEEETELKEIKSRRATI